jgi:hypothetical protein
MANGEPGCHEVVSPSAHLNFMAAKFAGEHVEVPEDEYDGRYVPSFWRQKASEPAAKPKLAGFNVRIAIEGEKELQGLGCGWRVVTCQFRGDKVVLHHAGDTATIKRKDFKELIEATRRAGPDVFVAHDLASAMAEQRTIPPPWDAPRCVLKTPRIASPRKFDCRVTPATNLRARAGTAKLQSQMKLDIKPDRSIQASPVRPGHG